MSDVNDSRNSRALACLRIAVGGLFLIFGEYKVFGTHFTLGGGFQWWINQFLADGAYPFMVPVLRGFVLRFATPIAFLVAYGELAIGISLVAGLWTRAASICGIAYMLTLLFSSNYPRPPCRTLAVLRRGSQSLGAGVLFCGVCDAGSLEAKSDRPEATVARAQR